MISDKIRENLTEWSAAAEWEATEENLTIHRYGLNKAFINRHRLTWIDGLQTGLGRDLADPKHPDHQKAYVQDYLRDHCPGGVKVARKCEANSRS